MIQSFLLQDKLSSSATFAEAGRDKFCCKMDNKKRRRIGGNRRVSLTKPQAGILDIFDALPKEAPAEDKEPVQVDECQEESCGGRVGEEEDGCEGGGRDLSSSVLTM